jgi:hypothetical protein
MLAAHEHVPRAAPVPADEHDHGPAAFDVRPADHRSVRLRGRDSNPNFLIQSQASYR